MAANLPLRIRDLSSSAMTNWFLDCFFFMPLKSQKGLGIMGGVYCLSCVYFIFHESEARLLPPARVSSFGESLRLQVVSGEGGWHKGCAVTSPPLPQLSEGSSVTQCCRTAAQLIRCITVPEFPVGRPATMPRVPLRCSSANFAKAR